MANADRNAKAKTIRNVDLVWLPKSLHGKIPKGSFVIRRSSAISLDSGPTLAAGLIRRCLYRLPRVPISRLAKRFNKGPTPKDVGVGSSSSNLRSSMTFSAEKLIQLVGKTNNPICFELLIDFFMKWTHFRFFFVS